ncbi:hypothetical protein [Erythrobacter sp. HKB08]|nr:hypothetical protein [Erythrobacter sp. HKB08]
MTRTQNTAKPAWDTPALKRIGSIADVAGKPVPVLQDAGNRKS